MFIIKFFNDATVWFHPDLFDTVDEAIEVAETHMQYVGDEAEYEICKIEKVYGG